MAMIEIAIICSIVSLLAFIAGLLTGGQMAMKWLKYGIQASYECRNGSHGLIDDDSADAELDMVNDMEQQLKGSEA